MFSGSIFCENPPLVQKCAPEVRSRYNVSHANHKLSFFSTDREIVTRYLFSRRGQNTNRGF